MYYSYWASGWFLLFYSPKPRILVDPGADGGGKGKSKEAGKKWREKKFPRSQVWISIYRNWFITLDSYANSRLRLGFAWLSRILPTPVVFISGDVKHGKRFWAIAWTIFEAHLINSLRFQRFNFSHFTLQVRLFFLVKRKSKIFGFRGVLHLKFPGKTSESPVISKRMKFP